MNLSVFYDHIAEAATQAGRPVSEICRIVRGYGIGAVEIENKRIAATETEVLNNLAAGGLRINSIYGFFDFGRHPDAAEGCGLIDLAVRTQVKKVLVIPGFVSEGEDAAPLLQNMKAVLTEMCGCAKGRGVTVALEDFDDISAPFATAEQLLWFMQNVPGLACNFDTGNFLYSEEDALQAFALLEEYIADNVHCKDRSLEKRDGEECKVTVGGREMYPSPVGYGCIPMKEIVSSLLRNGYRGSFAIEHFGAANQLDYMKKSADWLLGLGKDFE